MSPAWNIAWGIVLGFIILIIIFWIIAIILWAIFGSCVRDTATSSWNSWRKNMNWQPTVTAKSF